MRQKQYSFYLAFQHVISPCFLTIASSANQKLPVTLSNLRVFPYMQSETRGRLSVGAPSVLTAREIFPFIHSEESEAQSTEREQAVLEQVQARYSVPSGLNHTTFSTQYSWSSVSLIQCAPSESGFVIALVSKSRSMAWLA